MSVKFKPVWFVAALIALSPAPPPPIMAGAAMM